MIRFLLLPLTLLVALFLLSPSVASAGQDEKCPVVLPGAALSALMRAPGEHVGWPYRLSYDHTLFYRPRLRDPVGLIEVDWMDRLDRMGTPVTFVAIVLESRGFRGVTRMSLEGYRDSERMTCEEAKKSLEEVLVSAGYGPR